MTAAVGMRTSRRIRAHLEVFGLVVSLAVVDNWRMLKVVKGVEIFLP